LLVHGNNM